MGKYFITYQEYSTRTGLHPPRNYCTEEHPVLWLCKQNARALPGFSYVLLFYIEIPHAVADVYEYFGDHGELPKSY